MKRQLKFRAWAIESKLMILPDYDGDEYCLNLYENEVKLSYLDEIHYEGGGEIHTKYEWVDAESEIMQFTGFKDKEGKDVYEGDIFLSDDGDDYNGLVFWNHLEYCWGIDWGGSRDKFSDYHMEDFLVVGNIYETPEIIKP